MRCIGWRWHCHRKLRAIILSVRLACVRHAASVHPEPGSNSLTKSIQFRRTVNVFVRLSDPEDFWFVFRNFYEFTSQLLFPIFQTRRFVISESTGYKIHCLIFKVHPQPFPRAFAPFFWRLSIIPQFFPFVNPFFKKSFWSPVLQKSLKPLINQGFFDL